MGGAGGRSVCIRLVLAAGDHGRRSACGQRGFGRRGFGRRGFERRGAHREQYGLDARETMRVRSVRAGGERRRLYHRRRLRSIGSVPCAGLRGQGQGGAAQARHHVHDDDGLYLGGFECVWLFEGQMRALPEELTVARA